MSFLYSKKLAPYVFVFPFLLSFALFFAYPVFTTVVMSFQEVLPGQTKFINLDNYEKLWNPTFFKALRNSSIYTALTLCVLIPLPMLMAVFLNSKVIFARNLFRSVLFIPALTSVVVAGIIFRLIFGGQEGALLNSFISYAGYDPIKWLNGANTGMFALVVLATWRWLGVNLLYFLAGLQNIPQEIYEAAEIDGATAWDKLTRITLPMLKPIVIYVMTISIYGGYSMFVESYMLWGSNKSPGDIGLTIVGYLYRNGLEQNNLGFGSAIGITLLVLTFVIIMIQLKLFGMFRKEE
ncbi:carbohydrate ABC transporter permease [Paenibacillus alkalitolerans]|uniref:carbohydrate ABC transporter permease n=1 Tax=Paenibacillus alkalitolerans TaxID=2799335 RepID=UPI0018F56A71|nr:sugar ABC transporter permease [Paenibacillus alkalitolerans]